MIEKEGLRLDKFTGLNTQSPRGLAPSPCVLHNASLAYAGGYGCLPASSVALPNVLEAVYAGIGQTLFVRLASSFGKWDGATYTPFPYTVPSLAGALPIAPEVVYLPGATLGDDLLLTPLKAIPTYNLTTFAYWDGVGTAPSGPHWYYEGSTSAPDSSWRTLDTQMDVCVQVIRFAGQYTRRGSESWPTPPTLSRGFQTCSSMGLQVLTVGVSRPGAPFPPVNSSKYPAGSTAYRVRFARMAPLGAEGVIAAQFWLRERLQILPSTANKWKALKQSVQYIFSLAGYLQPDRVVDGPYALDEITVPHDPTLELLLLPNAYQEMAAPRITAATYHNARCWVASSAFYTAELPVEGSENPPEAQKNVQKRATLLSYSGVYFGIGDGEHGRLATPDWSASFYLEVPFKVSGTIAGLAGVGRYLYILGDREVAVLTGNSDSDFNLDLLGDSSGLVAPASLQRLGQSLFYLSDSGVVRLTGGEARDISAEVRDALLSLERATLSSTVDFVRELYLIGDAARLYVYHAREEAWVTRDGAGPLRYGGGRAYALEGGHLTSLGGERGANGQLPPLLPLKVQYQTLDTGDFWTRRTPHGVALALEADGNCTLALEVSAEGVVSSDTKPFGAGSSPARFALKRSTASAFDLTLTLTPSSSTRRAVLRPPITVKLDGVREERT